MAGIFDEMLARPWAAFSVGLEALGEAGSAVRRAETVMARVAHDLTIAPGGKDGTMAAAAITGNSGLSISSIPAGMEADAQVLPSVPEYLARGLDLKHWWDEVEAKGGPEYQFPLVRAFNRPTRAYGFFDKAHVCGQTMRVMGNVQEMFYDQNRAPASLGRDSAEWMREQLEIFVMKYFMRVSSFRPPEAFVDVAQPVPPPALNRFTWCPRPSGERVGFGFSQLFNKKIGSDSIDPVRSYDRHAIVDQRDIGKIFEWLLLRVRIFDFAFTAEPFGVRGPQVVFGLNEESYVVVHEQFVRHRSRPPRGGGAFEPLFDYGIGYAFAKSPTQSIFAYGPGEFDAAIQTINFRIFETGYISVRMVFIANRPSHVLKLEFDPVDWSFRLADLFSLGLTSQVLAPVKDLVGHIPFRFPFDPLGTFITTANALSGGAAGRTLCISMETLEKLFLLQHFRQHYQTILGSLETWRLIKDWKDTADLQKNFPWVVSGVGE